MPHDIEAIYKIVSSTNKKVDELCVGVGKINERCDARLKIIDGHTRTLYGQDGTGGIVSKQNSILGRLKNINNITADKKKWTKVIVAPIVVAIIVAIIIAAMTLWKSS